MHSHIHIYQCRLKKRHLFPFVGINVVSPGIKSPSSWSFTIDRNESNTKKDGIKRNKDVQNKSKKLIDDGHKNENGNNHIKGITIDLGGNLNNKRSVNKGNNSDNRDRRIGNKGNSNTKLVLQDNEDNKNNNRNNNDHRNRNGSNNSHNNNNNSNNSIKASVKSKPLRLQD